MQRADWNGVFPAITTPFKADDSIDIELFGRHIAWMADRGCNAFVTPGSLGEGGLVSLDEKRALWTRAVEVLANELPVVAAGGAGAAANPLGKARPERRCLNSWSQPSDQVRAVRKAVDGAPPAVSRRASVTEVVLVK